MRRRLIGALAVALVAFGCAGKKPIIPPEKLWGEAEDAFNTEAYELAVDRYKKLLDQHPFDQHAEAALQGILTDYPETDAAAECLYRFAQVYAARNEAEGATLALAALARHHPEGPLGREAKERLGATALSLDGDDPMKLLLTRIERMRGEADRQKLPNTVSAYPDIGGATPPTP